MSTPPTESIGERLRRLRLERGLSQRELAVPGVSYAYISRIEAGTRQPSVKALRKLAAKLGVSAGFLETGLALTDAEQRELELADAELQLRLNDDIARAEAALRRIAGEAEAAGDVAAAERAAIGLAFAALERGREQEAVAELERIVREYAPSTSTRPDVYAALGKTYALLGRTEEAVALFERCIAELGEDVPEDSATRARFAAYLGYALADVGLLDRAEDVVRQAIAEADEVGDPFTLVRLEWSLARLTTMQERPSVALRYARRAVALLEVTDNILDLARAHVLCAGILNTRGSTSPEVARHLDEAERLFGRAPARADLAYLRTEQAQYAAACGNGDLAVTYARETLELLRDADPAEQGLARSALGRGLAIGGDAEGARRELERALETLLEQGRWADARRCADALAQALRSLGRDADADAVIDRVEAVEETTAVEP